MISTRFYGEFRPEFSREIARVRCFRHHEDKMNCPSCKTEIDYRYLSNCTECGCAVEPAGPPQPTTIPHGQLIESIQKSRSWIRHLINLGYVLVNSVVGMISGGVIVYFGAAMIYCAIYSGVNENPSVACARGQAIGLLSIIVGGFLGTMLGSAFAVKRPLCKTPVD